MKFAFVFEVLNRAEAHAGNCKTNNLGPKKSDYCSAFLSVQIRVLCAVFPVDGKNEYPKLMGHLEIMM